jgi:myo-inositol catabolism protein IolC
MAQRGGRRARCLASGRHAPYDDLKHWLQVAAPIPGRAGFAIGRGMWWDPLRAHLRHLPTAGEAWRRIRATYLDYARYYLESREGTLPAEPDTAL